MNDMVNVHRILMQKHVNPFMVFDQMSIEAFVPIYEKMLKAGPVFVVEQEQKIVATRRIIQQEGHHAHSVEFASFGVDENHLRQGIGSFCYSSIISYVQEHMPWVKRIEIGQETDNDPALALATKQGMKVEVVTPDWIERTSNNNEKYNKKPNVGARWMCIHLFSESDTCQSNVSPFIPQLPQARASEDEMQFVRNGDNVLCYKKELLIATITKTPGSVRYSHVHFWNIKPEEGFEQQAMIACM